MKSFLSNSFAASAIVLMMVATASAFPGRGGSCTNCHDDGSGSVGLIPNPLEVMAGDSGVMTFDVTSLGGLPSLVVAIEGLDQAALDATVSGDWNFRSGSSGTSYQSGDVSAPTALTMPIAIGSGATPGTYPITVYLSGPGPAGTSALFDLTITEAIPEPATLTLTGMGFIALGALRRRRRR
ncbi:MAG: hypothetical protein CMJ58_02270 [Planctomycetaceae bacterium]|nr:hypothetical protein [Planctomycetaceae bacterium]